ncbi:MAG: hypothetical protein V4454_15825 [Pseudomonadota bacterium]
MGISSDQPLGDSAILNKEYGKLTAAQFRGFVDQLPLFQGQAEEMRKAMRDTPKERWRELLKSDYSWAWIYEFPFIVHIVLAVYAFNLGDWVADVASSPDPQQKVLDEILNDPVEDFHPDLEIQDGLGITVSLTRTIQSILLFGRSLSALIQDVRETENLDSLFKAIKVDRSVVNCPTVADCIAKAELQDNKAFFKRLSNAFKGPSQKEWAGLAGMKFSFNFLREAEIDDLSDAELEQLMVHTLEVYKDVPGARKNLRMHYQNFRKFPSI